jgi:molecular chaperone DnaJ
MTNPNHYQILKVSPNATQAEIKQAYRRLVKLFHPDSNQDSNDTEQIILINAAYEVLGDAQSRQRYDRQLQYVDNNSHNTVYNRANTHRQNRTEKAQQQFKRKRKTGRDIDAEVEEWLRLIYQPIHSCLSKILNSLEPQIEKLAADPFDDELLEEFQEYLEDCKKDIKKAEANFRSRPNPSSLAKTAANLYYCINQVNDGLDELAFFPLSYDDNYLHTGQEMFRIAGGLFYKAENSVI